MEVSVQRRIVDAAVELFSRKGFDGTSVQEVVDAARVTKGAMYHYFRSKDDLLYEIYHELITEQLAALDRIRALGQPPPQALRAIIVDLVESTAARLPAAAVYAREGHKLAGEPTAAQLVGAAPGERSGAALRAQRRRYHEGVRELVARGQRDGAFGTSASAETVTLVVFGIINQLPRWYRPDGPISPRRLADEIAGFVLAGLSSTQIEESYAQ